MTREEFEQFVMETYNAVCDYPWVRYPNYQVFRHPENNKWFALVADVPKSVFSQDSVEQTNDQTRTDVVNLKVDPIMLLTEPGIHPAYHMNKDKWVSVELGVASDETIKLLVSMSFDATAVKRKKKEHN